MKTSIITAAVAIAAIYLLTGCQLTVTAKPDYAAWFELFTGDEIPRAIIPTK
jgi:hypothetical protein